jgi:cyclase
MPFLRAGGPMKTRAPLRSIGFATLWGFAAAAHAQGPALGPSFGPADMTLVPVRDNIYMIRKAPSGNVTMLVGTKYVLLIDAKFPQDHDGIVKAIRSVTDLPVRYVVDTHLHPDHAGGNPAMQMIGAHIIASENTREIMAERQSPGLPDIAIRDYLRIFLDDMPVDLYYLGRGHTSTDIVVHLPTKRILVSGDLFALYEPYRAVIDYSAGGSLREWTRTLDRVLALDFDTVIPGHSGATDRERLMGYQAYLTRTQDLVREMNRQKRSQDDIRAMLQSELDWGGLEMAVGLQGVINEMQ